MGMISRILSMLSTEKGGVTVPEWKVELNKGQNIQAERYLPPGDDSQPLPEDRAGLVERTESGAMFAVGALDTVNEQIALPGEKRFYGRNEAGLPTSQFYMKNDGTIEVSNVSGMIITADPTGKISIVTPGFMEITAPQLKIISTVIIQGTVTIQGALTVTGLIVANAIQITTTIIGETITASVNAIIAGIGFITHIHGGVVSGSADTDPPQNP